MKICAYFLVVVPIFTLSAASQSTITKLFHHEGVLGNKLVCYIDKAPVCNRLPQRIAEASNAQEVFFLPMASLKGDVAATARALNSAPSHLYKVTIQEVQQPIQGVKIAFSFDPDKVAIDYAGFDAISRKKGVVFSVIDKTKLHDISLKTEPILRLALGKQAPTIVVDCGHGGVDCGKLGCFGITEKNITLTVGKRLAHSLQAEGYRVALTRDDDTFVPLDVRTKRANKAQADLFVSLHANAAASPSAQGIETYCLQPHLFTYPDKKLQPLGAAQKNSADCMAHSKRLAQAVHSNILEHAQPHYPLNDRSIRHSVAQVLLGVEMPSILVELGFLSNPAETKQLATPSYQKALVQGICSGINAYFKKSV